MSVANAPKIYVPPRSTSMATRRLGGGSLGVAMPVKTRPIPKLTESDKRRFWAKVNKNTTNGCWEWIGHCYSTGYGMLTVKMDTWAAHRISYKIHNGPIPSGLYVLHTCDNTICVNPDHLWLGSHLDNMRDMDSKGRRGVACGDNNGSRKHPERLCRGDDHWSRKCPEKRPWGDKNGSRKYPERLKRGEDNNTAKLTESQVKEIRTKFAAGDCTKMDLAKEYNVTSSNIGYIISRKSWAHVQ